MLIEPPLTIFVDEAGSPTYRALGKNGIFAGYIPCAAAVPTIDRKKLLAILPKDSSGGFIKSSHKEFTPKKAANLVQALLKSNIQIAALLIDPTHPKSIQAAQNTTKIVNAHRQEAHHPKITEAGQTYIHFVWQVIHNVLKTTLEQTGELPEFFDVVLDKGPLKNRHQSQYRKALKDAAENNGRCIRKVEWSDEESEPLLNIPDLVAGIFHRDASYGDASTARQILQDAGRSGRISIQDGLKINP